MSSGRCNVRPTIAQASILLSHAHIVAVSFIAEAAHVTNDALDDAIRALLAICGADAIPALRITLITYAFLAAEVARLQS